MKPEITSEMITESAWQAALREVQKEQADIIPKGFYPRSWWEKEMKKSQSHTKKIITTLCNAQKMESKLFTIITNGQLRETPHYKLK